LGAWDRQGQMIEDGIYGGRFEIRYAYESSSMIAGWEVDGIEECISVNLRNDRLDFILFLKVLLLLNQRECFISDDYIINNLTIGR
jgi:hypothetical protein